MTPNQFKSKFKSHQDAKKSLSEYYAAFTTAASSSNPPGFNSKFGMSLGASGWINYSPEMIRSAKRFSDLTTKFLGARYGDEKHLKDLIQKTAHDCLAKGMNTSGFQQAVIDTIAETLDQDFEIYLPNHLFSLYPRITPLKIGNVRVLSLVQLDSEIQTIVAGIASPRPGVSLTFQHNSHEIIFNLPSLSIGVPSARTMWAVKVKASRTHVHEEALWQIGIATSLMRLASSNWENRLPLLGDIEPNGVVLDRFAGDNALLRNGSGLSCGGGRVPGHYFVDRNVSKDLRAAKKQTKFDQVFSHNAGSVGEQIYNALGWAAKGRQSIDRAERLLYFFTAIEAILTRQSNDSPVIDTIARHGSVMLANSIASRPQIAKRFKTLYGFRSSTVHRGARTASALVVKEAQFLAESLIGAALSEVSPQMSHNTFSDELAKASYGFKWP